MSTIRNYGWCNSKSKHPVCALCHIPPRTINRICTRCLWPNPVPMSRSDFPQAFYRCRSRCEPTQLIFPLSIFFMEGYLIYYFSGRSKLLWDTKFENFSHPNFRALERHNGTCNHSSENNTFIDVGFEGRWRTVRIGASAADSLTARQWMIDSEGMNVHLNEVPRRSQWVLILRY